MAAFRTAEDVYNVCRPKPKPLLKGHHSLLRHGVLLYFSPNTRTRKPRYFFLFNDFLLLTKAGYGPRSGVYWLKIFIHLRKGITVERDADTQFRLIIPQANGARTFTFWARNSSEKEAWLKEIEHTLWIINGKKGRDPSTNLYIPDERSSSRRERERENRDESFYDSPPRDRRRGHSPHRYNDRGYDNEPRYEGGYGGGYPHDDHNLRSHDRGSSIQDKAPKPVQYAMEMGKGVTDKFSTDKVGEIGSKVSGVGKGVGKGVKAKGSVYGKNVQKNVSLYSKGVSEKLPTRKMSGIIPSVKDGVTSIPSTVAKVPGAALGGGAKVTGTIKQKVTGAGPYDGRDYGGSGRSEDYRRHHADSHNSDIYGGSGGYDERHHSRRNDSDYNRGKGSYRDHDDHGYHDRGGSYRHNDDDDGGIWGDNPDRRYNSKNNQGKSDYRDNKGGSYRGGRGGQEDRKTHSNKSKSSRESRKKRPGLVEHNEDYFKGYTFSSEGEESLFSSKEDDFFSPREKDSKYGFFEEEKIVKKKSSKMKKKQSSSGSFWDDEKQSRYESQKYPGDFGLSGSESSDEDRHYKDSSDDDEWTFDLPSKESGGGFDDFGDDIIFVAPPPSKFSRDTSIHGSSRTDASYHYNKPKQQKEKSISSTTTPVKSYSSMQDMKATTTTTTTTPVKSYSSTPDMKDVSSGLLLLDLSTPVSTPVLDSTTSPITAHTGYTTSKQLPTGYSTTSPSPFNVGYPVQHSGSSIPPHSTYHNTTTSSILSSPFVPRAASSLYPTTTPSVGTSPMTLYPPPSSHMPSTTPSYANFYLDRPQAAHAYPQSGALPHLASPTLGTASASEEVLSRRAQLTFNSLGSATNISLYNQPNSHLNSGGISGGGGGGGGGGYTRGGTTATPPSYHTSSPLPTSSTSTPITTTGTSPFGMSLDLASTQRYGDVTGTKTSPRLLDLSRLSPEEFARFTSHGFSAGQVTSHSSVGTGNTPTPTYTTTTNATTVNPFGF